MREPKYRAWDTDAEYMFYSDKPEDDYFFEFKDGRLLGFAVRPPKGSSDPMEPPEPYCDEFPVEEYIGLKDKAKVEIYEGTISQTICNGGIKLSKFVYFYNEGLARFQKRRVKDGMVYDCDKISEGGKFIIGDIHSNPELLKERQGLRTWQSQAN